MTGRPNWNEAHEQTNGKVQSNITAPDLIRDAWGPRVNSVSKAELKEHAIAVNKFNAAEFLALGPPSPGDGDGYANSKSNAPYIEAEKELGLSKNASSKQLDEALDQEFGISDKSTPHQILVASTRADNELQAVSLGFAKNTPEKEVETKADIVSDTFEGGLSKSDINKVRKALYLRDESDTQIKHLIITSLGLDANASSADVKKAAFKDTTLGSNRWGGINSSSEKLNFEFLSVAEHLPQPK